MIHSKAIIIISLILAAACSLVIWSLGSGIQALALFTGALWGVVNLYLIDILAITFLLTKKYAVALIIAFVKFPLLYFLGYLLLNASFWNPWYVAAGLPLAFLGAMIASFKPDFLKNDIKDNNDNKDIKGNLLSLLSLMSLLSFLSFKGGT